MLQRDSTHHDRSRCWPSSLENKLNDLDRASVAGMPESEGWNWVHLVLEYRAGSIDHEKGPNLALYLDVFGYLNGVSDQVSSVVDVSDFVRSDRVEEILHTSCVVRKTVTCAPSVM